MARAFGEDPYSDGFQAYKQGKSWGSNPYDSECEPVNWALWARGFDEALQMARTANHVDGYDRDDLGESPDY